MHPVIEKDIVTGYALTCDNIERNIIKLQVINNFSSAIQELLAVVDQLELDEKMFLRRKLDREKVFFMRVQF